MKPLKSNKYGCRYYQGLDHWWYVRGPMDTLLHRCKTEGEAIKFIESDMPEQVRLADEIIEGILEEERKKKGN
jgi:hypothetical protein